MGHINAEAGRQKGMLKFALHRRKKKKETKIKEKRAKLNKINMDKY